jgi:hypothetical protein
MHDYRDGNKAHRGARSVASYAGAAAQVSRVRMRAERSAGHPAGGKEVMRRIRALFPVLAAGFRSHRGDGPGRLPAGVLPDGQESTK